MLELEELHLQIGGRPEERAVQAFPSNRTDESLDEWMRERRVWHCLEPGRPRAVLNRSVA